jgi:hypothetical protein
VWDGGMRLRLRILMPHTRQVDGRESEELDHPLSKILPRFFSQPSNSRL